MCGVLRAAKHWSGACFENTIAIPERDSSCWSSRSLPAKNETFELPKILNIQATSYTNKTNEIRINRSSVGGKQIVVLLALICVQPAFFFSLKGGFWVGTLTFL